MFKSVVTRTPVLIFLAASVVSGQSAPSRKDIPAIAESAKGAIVSIVMYEKGRPIAQGTGFVVSKDGVIVTNFHVIQTGSSAIAKLPEGDFFPVDGVLSADKTRDIAVIKTHGKTFRTLALGNSDQLRVGEEVVAIGNPLSLESTVSNGIVSGMRTSEELGGQFLQITAPISHGSSGGPLFNMAGEVVGITTLGIEGGENLNFAIPINEAKRMLVARFSKIQDLPNEPEPRETRPQETRKGTLAEQKMCSEQAELKFKKDNPENHSDFSWNVSRHSSHYDASTGVCYMELISYAHSGRNETKMVSTFGDVEDVNGGGRFGFLFNMTWENRTDLNLRPDCYIRPPGRPEVKCRSVEEFQSLAQKYLGIAPP